MSKRDNNSLLQVDELISEVVNGSHATPNHTPVSDTGRHDVQLILNSDYGSQLNRQFSPQDLRSVLKVMRLAVPRLNLAQFRPENLVELKRTANRLGTRFVAQSFTGNDGLSLLGFYVDEQRPARRPTICVNTAHHPVAIAAAFWHEVGHHLTARLLNDLQEPIHFSLRAEYYKHLEQPLELIADILVSLAAYPKRTARRLFGYLAEAGGLGAAPIWNEILRKAKRHLQIETGFEFIEDLPAAQNLHYLAGMIHFTKLRMALLSEYDV